MRALDITEVARRSGTPASALRYYEEKGLIASIGRRGLRRLFDPSVLERLSLVALGRASGFSLDEIGEMFAADGRPQIDRARLSAKADELEATIQRLTLMRDGLRHAAEVRAFRVAGRRTGRRIVKLAGEGQLEGALRRPFVAEAV